LLQRISVYERRLRAVLRVPAILALVMCAIAASGQEPLPRITPATSPLLPSELVRVNERGAAEPKVTIVEFVDFQCPFCARSAAALRNLLRDYPDKVRLIVKHCPLNIHPGAELLHEAALAAGEQGKFWEMHDLLFDRQGKLGISELESMAQEIGLDVPKFRQAVEEARFKDIIQHDRDEARAFGVNGTPTFFINGHRLSGVQSFENLKKIVEVELSGNTPSHSVPLPGTRISDIKLEGAPLRGTANAPITIVEFSDMQCPFCAREATVLQQVLADYPGRVQWIFKNFPLSFHINAPLAHEAVMAAGAQGKFWEMHDLIFANQKTMARGDLDRFARQIGLDMQRFDADLDGSKYHDRIQADQDEGERLNVSGTPTIFLNGRRLVGAQQLMELARTISDELKIAPAVRASQGTGSSAAASPRLGSPSAPVTITWYADLDSPLTAEAERMLRSVLRDHPADVQVIFRNRPLNMYPESELIHEAAMAAFSQGKFWEFEQLVAESRTPAHRADLLAYAAKVGIDVKKFTEALDQHRYRAQVADDLREAQRLDVRGSPTLFVNATRVDGIPSAARFAEMVQEEISRSQRVQTALRAGDKSAEANQTR
jgi:protein-disulfide isomerase